VAQAPVITKINFRTCAAYPWLFTIINYRFMKKKNKSKKFKLDKRSIAKLDSPDMNQIAAGQEAEPDFLSLFACKSKKCETVDCQTLIFCSFTQCCQITV